MNLSMGGNLVAVLLVGISVWLGMQWRPSPHDEYLMMVAIALAFSGGVLTAISSQIRVTLQPVETTERASGADREGV